MAAEAFQNRKSLLMDIINRTAISNNQPSPEVPVPLAPVPSWCKCGRCREMPTQKERKCCNKRICLTLDQTFYEICVNGTTLEVAINSRSDIRVERPTFDNRTLRHIGYRQFVMWKQGPLGAGNRVVIPSCCVWRIRTQYPSPLNQYTGYCDH